MPLARVVIPTFNRATLLADALDSVLAQTFQDFEIIVVDDGSTDATGEVLREFVARDRRIRYFRRSNGGVAHARNQAIGEPGGHKYIAFLDSDDCWKPWHLQQAVAVLEGEAEAALVFARTEIPAGLSGHWTQEALASHAAKLEKVLKGGTPLSMNGGYLLSPALCVEGLLYNELAPHPSTVVIRRGAVSRPTWFDTRLRVLEDVELFLRIAADRHSFAFVDSVSARVRYHGDNITSGQDLSSPTTLVKQQSVLKYYKIKLGFCSTRAESHFVTREIAETAWLLGQCHAEQQDLASARAAYWDALRYRFSSRVFKSFIGSLLPMGLHTFLKTARRRLSNAYP